MVHTGWLAKQIERTGLPPHLALVEGQRWSRTGCGGRARRRCLSGRDVHLRLGHAGSEQVVHVDDADRAFLSSTTISAVMAAAFRTSSAEATSASGPIVFGSGVITSSTGPLENVAGEMTAKVAVGDDADQPAAPRR